MLEKTFEKFIQKKHPEVIELLHLAKEEQEKRRKRLEEEMLKFTTAFRNDLKKIFDEELEKKLEEYGITRKD